MQESYPIRSRNVGVNVPRAERIASTVLGSAAIIEGLRRRSVGGVLLAATGAYGVLRGITGRCALYRARAIRKGVMVRRAVTIQSTPNEVYDLWRDLTNLPKFMSHVKSVTVDPDGTSRWVVAVGHRELEWRAEIVEDSPGRRLRWRSLPGGDIRTEGMLDLRQAPGDRGTIVEVKVRYFPPGGLLVASTFHGFLRKLTGVGIGMELARLQQLLETGELTTGARRIDDLDETDRTIIAAQIKPEQPVPITTAQTSQWDGEPARTTGGTR